MTRWRDELANNLAKLSAINDRKSEVKKHLAREHRKLTETNDTDIQQDIQDRMEKLKGELSDIELERQARLKALCTNRAALRSQINRICETIRRLLHEDKTLAERIRTLFREQGITNASILTAISMVISTLVLAVTGGGSAPVPLPALKRSDKGRAKEWIKKHLQALGRTLVNLAGKAAAALPRIRGSIVSWLLSTLGKATTWLADNVWAFVIGVGALLMGLAISTTAKAPLGRPRPLRLWDPFSLLRGLSQPWQTHVVAQQHWLVLVVMLRVCHSVAPCDQSQPMLRFFLRRTYRLWSCRSAPLIPGLWLMAASDPAITISLL